MNTKNMAVILAAGRGSRMQELTAQKPKCLLELAGKPLLQWQLEALHSAGLKDILLVRGYMGHLLHEQRPAFAHHLRTVENPRWQSSNMLRTLVCAEAEIRQAFAHGAQGVVVAYADIVYHPSHVTALLNCTSDVAITYDTQWESLWRLRFGDPLLDAETFCQHEGRLVHIGDKPASLHEVQGQYMGLLAFSAAGWEHVSQLAASLGEKLDSTDMTAFLRLMLAQNVLVGTVPVAGKWCEADNGEDLQRYQQALHAGAWLHDWR